MKKALQVISVAAISTSILLLSACSVAPSHATLQAAKLPTLLPVRDFVANTDYNGLYRISPDGNKLAWQAVNGMTESTFIKTLASGEVTIIPIKGEYLWAQDSRRLLFYRDHKGNENYHILSVDTVNPDAEPRDLSPYAGARAYVQQIIEDDPQHVLIAHNRRDPRVFDLMKVDLENGKEVAIATNPGTVIRWLTDRDGALWGRVRKAETTYHLERQDAGTDAWRSVYQWDRFDSVHPLALSADQQSVWMLSNRGRDLVALVKLNFASEQEKIVYQHPKVDVGDLLFSQQTREPILAYLEPDYPQLEFLDNALQKDLAPFLSTASPRGLRISSMDEQDRRLIVESYTSIGRQFYLFDRATKQQTLLGENASMKFAESLAPVKPITTKQHPATSHRSMCFPSSEIFKARSAPASRRQCMGKAARCRGSILSHARG